MRWEDERQSEHVEDRRGDGPGGAGPFGGGFGMGRGGGTGFPIPMGRMGIGGIIVVVILMFVLGIDPSAMLGGGGPQFQPAPQSRPQGTPGDVATRPATQGDDQMRRFVGAVLANTENVWRDQLPRQTGQQYREPTLVLFSGATNTECGMGQAAMGPFYCPPDQKLYIDLSFYNDLAHRLKAPGDFAQAYVLAHEVGHHIQNLLGISSRMQQLRRQASETEYNKMSVRVELQADCFAGVWGFHASRLGKITLEPGDVEEALRAASAIGDDRLQKQSRGMVVPDSFTHGTSEQRVRWFKRGFESGQMGVCDTFQAQQL